MFFISFKEFRTDGKKDFLNLVVLQKGKPNLPVFEFRVFLLNIFPVWEYSLQISIYI